MKIELIGGPKDGHIVDINSASTTISYPVIEIINGKPVAVAREVYRYNPQRKKYIHQGRKLVTLRTDPPHE